MTTALVSLSGAGVANAQHPGELDWSLVVHNSHFEHQRDRTRIEFSTKDDNCEQIGDPSVCGPVAQVREWVTRGDTTLKSKATQGLPAFGTFIMKQRVRRGDVLHVAADGVERASAVFRGYGKVAPVSCGQKKVRRLTRSTVAVYRRGPQGYFPLGGHFVAPNVWRALQPLRSSDILELEWADRYGPGVTSRRYANIFASMDRLDYEIVDDIRPACH